MVPSIGGTPHFLGTLPPELRASTWKAPAVISR